MKLKFLLLSLFAGALTTFAQTGAWVGSLEIQGMGSLPLIFNLDDDNPTIDSPEQNAKGIPVELQRNDNTITVTIPMIGAKYEGIAAEDRIEGIFSQGGYSFPLTLRPKEEKK